MLALEIVGLLLQYQLTATLPVPKEPDQEPPLKEIHFRSPNGVLPMDIRGLSFTDMRKSCVRTGVGRDSVGYGRVSAWGARGVLVERDLARARFGIRRLRKRSYA